MCIYEDFLKYIQAHEAELMIPDDGQEIGNRKLPKPCSPPFNEVLKILFHRDGGKKKKKLQAKYPGLGLQFYFCYNFKSQRIGVSVCACVHAYALRMELVK